MIVYDEKGKAITINSNPIGSGGEGSVYMHPNNDKQVIKVYHNKKPSTFVKIIKSLQQLDSRFIKPIDLFYDSNKNLIGISMFFVNFNDYFLLNTLFNKSHCIKNNIDNDLKIKILDELKDAVESCHKLDLIVGDLNQYNIFYSLSGNIKLIDVDSYSNKDIVNDVLLEDIQDFTSTSINKHTDIYSYSVLSFWILTYAHPFKWIVKGNTETLKQRVMAGKSYLSNIKDIIIPALYNPPTGDLKEQYKEIFNFNKRYFISYNGAALASPYIPTTSLVSSNVNIIEIENNITDYKVCNNYISVKEGKNWKAIHCSTKGHFSTPLIKTCDIMYPSSSNYAYVKDNKLYNWQDIVVKDLSYTYQYFQNGELFVLNYHADTCNIFKIDNQIVGIDQNILSIFSKSINIRNSIIQNLGAKKFTFILRNKNIVMIEIPETTEDLIIYNNYMCIEYLEKGKMVYAIFKINGTKLDKIMYVDHLVHFCVLNEYIFIPYDKEIKVYLANTLVDKFDVPMCTDTSELTMVTSGLILYENKHLYLINKK